MKTNREKLSVSIQINTPAKRVWEGLTDPKWVKQYFFGTNLESDWKKGSPIFFRGEWEGKKYEDKGTIRSIEPGRFVEYDYWSSMCGKPDIPENYRLISYELAEIGGGTRLVITQECDPETREHSEQNWKGLLEALKKLLES